MADFINKKYKLYSSDKFDEYMIELNIGFMSRKLGNSATPVVEVTINGDEYTLTTTTLLKTTVIKFKLGQEFDEERLDGTKVKSIITLDGNVMTHVMKGSPETVITREFSGSEMKAVLKVSNVVCTRVYKAEWNLVPMVIRFDSTTTMHLIWIWFWNVENFDCFFFFMFNYHFLQKSLSSISKLRKWLLGRTVFS